MMRPFAAAVLALALAGCSEPIEYGPERTEPGRVKQLVFVPSGHGSDVAVGYSTSGRVTFTPIDIDIPARYGIVLEWDGGSFAIEGEVWAETWKTLREGQEVEIRYREMWARGPDGSRQFAGRDFVGVGTASPAVGGGFGTATK